MEKLADIRSRYRCSKRELEYLCYGLERFLERISNSLAVKFYPIEFRERWKIGCKVIEVLKRGRRHRNLQNILLYFVEQ